MELDVRLSLLVAALSLIGCSISPGSQSELPQNSIREASAGSEHREESDANNGQIEVGRTAYYVPLEPGDMSSACDPNWAVQWRLYYFCKGGDAGDIIIDARYDVLEDRVHGSGTMGQGGIRFDIFNFDSSQQFVGLLDYLGQHPDVMFDHSEFEGLEAGDIAFPEGAIEGFCLDVPAWEEIDGRPVYYAIEKGIVPGEEVPEELRYVLDTIRTEFAEVIAGRTIPRPQ